MTVEVQINSPRLARLIETLEGQQRVQLNAIMGEAAKEETRDYLREIAQTRHQSAARVGGEPTGHLERAAQAVESADVESDDLSASFTIDHPGIGRAFHDVTIRPTGGKQFLTIPLNALAYGHRCGEFDRVAFVRSSTASSSAPKGSEKKASKTQPLPTDVPVFLLTPEVFQAQDRSLLPSDEQWTRAAKDAAIELIRAAA